MTEPLGREKMSSAVKPSGKSYSSPVEADIISAEERRAALLGKQESSWSNRGIHLAP